MRVLFCVNQVFWTTWRTGSFKPEMPTNSFLPLFTALFIVVRGIPLRVCTEERPTHKRPEMSAQQHQSVLIYGKGIKVKACYKAFYF